MLCITGSKFFGGPAFSGALLVPAKVARKSGRFPMEEAPNFGLLLRWEAALASLRAFRALPEEKTRQFMQVFHRRWRRAWQPIPAWKRCPSPH